MKPYPRRVDEVRRVGHLEVLTTPEGVEALGLMGRRLRPGDEIELLLWEEWVRGAVFFVGPVPYVRTHLAAVRIGAYTALRWTQTARPLPNRRSTC